MAKADLTPDRLRELLSYDPETGVFRWRAARNSNRAPEGKAAGWIQTSGKYGKPRITIEVDQRNYMAHRLAWLHTHGEWPAGVIDHINGDSLDNRIANLRDVSQRVNTQNRRVPRRNSASGLLGVCWDESRKSWIVAIKDGEKQKYLGRFDDPNEAQLVYIEAKRKLHEGCTI